MDLIGKLDKEQKIEEKQNKINSKVLDKIIKCYETSLDQIDMYLEDSYNRCIASIKKLNQDYGVNEISEFSISFTNFQNHNEFSVGTGLFLSALINNSKENDFAIYTNYLQRQIDFMFWRNVKNIVVNGSIGRDAGRFMAAGSVLINGNVGMFLGAGMDGGKITVNGNTGFGMGYLMHKNAILKINGDYDSIATTCAGKIYHNNELIFANNCLQKDYFEYVFDENLPSVVRRR